MEKKQRTPFRLMKLAGLSANVAGKMAMHKAKGLFRETTLVETSRHEVLESIGSEVARTLSEMKGAVMKVGQIASQFRDVFPDEIARELECLQFQAEPMPFEIIAGQIERELGQPPEDLFASFDRAPSGCASIGQVHRAQLHTGETVVVKVQYPGVRQACDSDLKHLKALFKMASLLGLDEEMVKTLFEEIRQSLYLELDYEAEARNLLAFSDYYRDDSSVIVPSFFPAYSSASILTMSCEMGTPLSKLRDSGASQREIDAVGQRLFRFVLEQLFDAAMIHADPHPGNYAVAPDGRVILYDFGAVRRLSGQISEDLKDLVRAVFSANAPVIDEVLVRRGVRNPTSGQLPLTFYDAYLEVLANPFAPNTCFDFGASDLHKQFMRLAKDDFRQGLRHFSLTAESIHIDRAFTGHYWNLVQMGARVSLREELERFVGPL